MSSSTSRTGRFIRGLSFGYVNTGLTLLLGLWLTPFLLHRLGDGQYGKWLMIGQAILYLGLTDLGIVALLSRETAFAVGRAGRPDDASELPEIVGRTIRLVIWQLPFVVLIAIAAWLVARGQAGDATEPLAWLLLVFVLRFPLRVFMEILVGLQDLHFLGQLQLAGFILTAALTIGLVIAGWGLMALVAGWAAGQFIPPVACWMRLRRRFPLVLPSSLPSLPWAVAKNQLTKGGWVSVAQLAHVLVYGSDVLILGNILGPAAVVTYVCTGKLVSVLQNQPQLIMETARPALSELRASSERARLHNVTSALTLTALLAGGLIACGIAGTNRAFTALWVGESFFGGAGLTAALIANMLVRLWNATTIYAIFAFGYEKRISLTTLGDGILTIGLMILLVPHIGLIGAPIASITSVILISLPWNLSALATEVQVSVVRQILELAGWFIRFAAVLGLTIWVDRSFSPSGFYSIFGLSLLVTCAYVVLMLPLVRRAPLRGYVQPVLANLRTRIGQADWRRDDTT